MRLRFSFLLGAACAMFAASTAQASEADALAISARIQAIHVPYGTVLNPVFAGPGSTQIVGYTRCGDSAIWTGHYLAAEAFRHQVTQSADALADVKSALAGIKSLLDVTGTDVLARCLVPLNSPYAAGIRGEEAGNGIFINNAMGDFWVGNTSRDQYLGVIFGLGVAYDMVGDAAVRTSITQITTRIINFLAGHAWTIVLPDGSIPTTFVIRPDQILTILQVGRHVNASVFSGMYDSNALALAGEVLAPIAVDAASDSSYFKFNLDYISFYNLVRLQGGVTQSIYKSAYDVLRGATGGDQNAMFDMIDRALNGPNAERDFEAAALTNEWLQRSLLDVTTDNRKIVPVCGSEACTPIPVVLRPPDEFLWEESPFQLAAAGGDAIETAGIDYLLPYWMGRYYGVIPAIQVQSAAAPNRAVTSNSIGSIFGSNLAAAPVDAGVQPPPLSLGGVTVNVTDVAGGPTLPVPLMYVSPSQINFVMPTGVASGAARFSIITGSATLTATATVQSVAPAIFSMSADGKGVAAAEALNIPIANSQSSVFVPVFSCTNSGCAPTPIHLDANNNTFLILYATGVRNRSSPANVTATIGNTILPVAFAGAQPSYQGLDQVNVQLPPSLRGSGAVNVFLRVDGQVSNVVTIDIE